MVSALPSESIGKAPELACAASHRVAAREHPSKTTRRGSRHGCLGALRGATTVTELEWPCDTTRVTALGTESRAHSHQPVSVADWRMEYGQAGLDAWALTAEISLQS